MAAVLTVPAGANGLLAGKADVVDGDTLVIRGLDDRVRLYGIDAPEGDQTCADPGGQPVRCGDRATDALVALVGAGDAVRCREVERDRYGRIVATCAVAGRDVGDALVRSGWALEDARYSDGRYAGAEAEARRAGRGLWAGRFEEPWTWRDRLRAKNAASTDAAPDGCAIKGNVSKAGRVYHRPGSRDYDGTRIDPARGERWFCSTAEAEAAGWRAPLG